MNSLTLKHNSFQSKIIQNPLGFAPRPLVFKLQEEVTKD